MSVSLSELLSHHKSQLQCFLLVDKREADTQQSNQTVCLTAEHMLAVMHIFVCSPDKEEIQKLPCCLGDSV